MTQEAALGTISEVWDGRCKFFTFGDCESWYSGVTRVDQYVSWIGQYVQDLGETPVQSEPSSEIDDSENDQNSNNQNENNSNGNDQNGNDQNGNNSNESDPNGQVGDDNLGETDSDNANAGTEDGGQPFSRQSLWR